MMATAAPPAATSARSPFSSRTRWPLRRLLLVGAPLGPSSSPALTTPLCFRCSPWAEQPHHLTARKAIRWGRRPAVLAAAPSERWLLEPVGDGKRRHIGTKMPMPGAFEMASDVVTVGRLPDKADVAIPVDTVSRLHARLEKKEGTLLVTDLDSTNGTFVDDIKLRPGAATTVSSGSRITFGDTHFGMFRVSKLQDENLSGATADSGIKTEIEVPQTETES